MEPPDQSATIKQVEKAVIQMYQYLRDVCTTKLLNTLIQLGGQDEVVQIDEGLFNHLNTGVDDDHRKNHEYLDWPAYHTSLLSSSWKLKRRGTQQHFSQTFERLNFNPVLSFIQTKGEPTTTSSLN